MTNNYSTSGYVGRYTGMNISTEYTQTLGYDTYGRLNSVADGTDTFSYSFTTNSDLIASVTRPYNLTTDYSYEANRDLVNYVENKYSATTISKYDYTNDAIGRRTAKSRTGTAFTTADAITFGYNDRNEVTSAVSNNIAAYNYAFAFDNIGNRSSYTVAGTSTAYTANNLNQYTAITQGSTINPAYNADGCITGIGTANGTWNGENRLVEIYDDTTGKKLEFKYDYMGRRVEKKVYTGSSTTSWALSADLKFVYDGYKLIEVLDGQNSDAILQKFLWSGDELLSVYDTAASATYYYFADANKNIGQLMDSSGNIVAKYEYSPFGVQTLATGTYASTNPFRFSSEYYDSETQLVYYNYRYYSPLLGRWLSRDPIEEDGGYNLYGFIDNNPVDYWDYLGMDYSTPWNPNGFPDYPPGFLPNNISPNDFTDDGVGPEAATLAITGLGSLLGNYFMMRNDGSSIAGALYNSANLTYNPLRGMFEAFSGIDFGYENPGGQLSSLDRWSRGLTSLGETLLFAAAGLEAARSCPACKANIGEGAETAAQNLKYHERIRARGLQDPQAHNFPYSFDKRILKTTPKIQSDGSYLYRMKGAINGKNGYYEIAINPKTKTIFHRSFNSK